MQSIDLIQEKQQDILQRAYTYLASKYDKRNLNIVDHTYKFTYRDNPVFLNLFDIEKRELKLEAFLFVNADINQHYFFLPFNHLIIECNNGQFKALALSEYTKDEKYCVNLINQLFSSFQAYDFANFNHFNQFRQPDFNIESFSRKLDGNAKKNLNALLNDKDQKYGQRYKTLFPYWIRYFFNLLQDSTTFCDNVSFDIDLDLSHKEDFYVLEKGVFNHHCKEVNPNDWLLLTKKETQLSGVLNDFLDKNFSPIMDARSDCIRSSKLRSALYYFTEMVKMTFFIPFKGVRNDAETTYLSRLTSNGLIKDWLKLNAGNLACVGNSADELFGNYKLCNKIYTLSDIHQQIDFELFNEDDITAFDFSYDSVLVFGHKAKVEFIREYAKYQLDYANDILLSDEADPSIFNLSKDDFFKKMEELYSLLNKTKELRHLDQQRYKNLMDAFAIKTNLDADIHVI